MKTKYFFNVKTANFVKLDTKQKINIFYGTYGKFSNSIAWVEITKEAYDNLSMILEVFRNANSNHP